MTTMFEQLNQIAASTSYESNVARAAARSQTHLQGDLNVLRSLLAALQGTTEFDDAPAKTIAQLAAQTAPEDVIFLQFVQPMDEANAGDQTVVIANQGVDYMDLSLNIAGEVVDSEGAGTPGAWAAQLTSQSDYVSAHNQVEIRDYATKQPMVDANGRPVQGFLQLAGPGAALPHTLTGNTIYLTVRLRVWNGSAYVAYNATADDSMKQWEVALPRFVSLATMSKRGFGPMFVDVAEAAELGNVLGLNLTYGGATGSNVASRITSLSNAIGTNVATIGEINNDLSGLMSYVGSDGSSSTPTYANANYITQYGAHTVTIGELDAALATEASTRATADTTNATNLTNHINDATDAHMATAIGVASDPTGGGATTVAGVLSNLNQKIDDTSAAFTDITVPSGISASSQLTVPSFTKSATPGQNARFVYNGRWLVPGEDYTEDGTVGQATTTITMLRALNQNKKVTAMVLK